MTCNDFHKTIQGSFNLTHFGSQSINGKVDHQTKKSYVEDELAKRIECLGLIKFLFL